MNYTIEMGKIVEGALKRDQLKVVSYTEQLVRKLEEDGENRTAGKFRRMVDDYNRTVLSPQGSISQKSIPVDTESISALADVLYPDANLGRVILSESNKRQVCEYLIGYRRADALNVLGLGAPNKLLLYGPPGCGKTRTAFYIARELNLPIVAARLDGLISSYLGTTAKNIRSLLEFAQKKPCVLFLDEFDALAKARDDDNELGELKRVVNSLLQAIDSYDDHSLLIAATNHEKLLDSAAWRRFNYRIEISLPEKEDIEQFISLNLPSAFSLNSKEMRLLSVLFVGSTGAEIEDVIRRALRASVIYEEEMNYRLIFREYFVAKSLFPQEGGDKKAILRYQTRYLRDKDARAFSYGTIANALGVSKTTVSNILKNEE